jgi:hypothetical protein
MGRFMLRDLFLKAHHRRHASHPSREPAFVHTVDTAFTCTFRFVSMLIVYTLLTQPFVLVHRPCIVYLPPRPPRSSCMPIAGSGASGNSCFAFSIPPAESRPSVAWPPVPSFADLQIRQLDTPTATHLDARMSFACILKRDTRSLGRPLGTDTHCSCSRASTDVWRRCRGYTYFSPSLRLLVWISFLSPFFALFTLCSSSGSMLVSVFAFVDALFG